MSKEYQSIFQIKNDPETYSDISKVFEEIWWGISRWARNIKRVCLWIPLIWKDGDNDWMYLLTLIEYKLKRMKACFDGNFVGSEEVIADIDKILASIQRLSKSEHCEKEWEEYYKKYPVLLKNPMERPENWKEALEESKQIFEKEDALIDKDINEICDTMKKMRRWWV